MATNRKRDSDSEPQITEETLTDKGAIDWSKVGVQAEATPGNADEARAVDDPQPSWATDEPVREVMTTRDQRRAGVLDSLRHNDGSRNLAERGEGGGSLVVVGPATAWLDQALSAEMTTGDSEAAYAVENILTRVMNATTLEELLADESVFDARALLDEKLQFWGFKVNKSDFADGMKGYMVIEAIRRSDGQNILVSCGAYRVQAVMLRAKTLNLFPFLAHFTEVMTRSGNRTLNLVLDKD